MQSSLAKRSLITSVASTSRALRYENILQHFLQSLSNQPFIVKFVIILQLEHQGLVVVNAENISYFASIIIVC